MFQFTRNNETFKCSPMIVEGFDGDSDNDSGFICTNTKNSVVQNITNINKPVENFQNNTYKPVENFQYNDYSLSNTNKPVENFQNNNTYQDCVNAVENTGFIPRVTWGSTPSNKIDATCDQKLCQYWPQKYPNGVPDRYKPSIVNCPPPFPKLNCAGDQIQAGNFCYPSSIINK